MATVTTGGSVGITADVVVLIRNAGLVAVLVAVYAAKCCVVRRVSVAISASSPHSLPVRTGIDREPDVIEGCAGPGDRCVARGTSRRERRSDVVRIRSAGKLGLMARIAIGGHCGVVATHMAERA